MQYFNREGKELGWVEWALLVNDAKYVRVVREEVGPYNISTVWTGLHLRYHPTAQVLIFETMVFEDGEPLDCLRWSSEQAAIEGHKKVVDGFKQFGCGDQTKLP